MPKPIAQSKPLSFKAVDSGKNPTLEQVLEFLSAPRTPSDIGSLVRRYHQAKRELPVDFVIADPKIFKKILWPLRQAKASYMLGSYVAVIALCGMVAEMVAIFLWELSGEKLDEESVFGRTFENLGQERRIKILLAYRKISEEDKASFNEIRKTRRRYLHFWSKDRTPGEEQEDALKVFQETMLLMPRICEDADSDLYGSR